MRHPVTHHSYLYPVLLFLLSFILLFIVWLLWEGMTWSGAVLYGVALLIVIAILYHRDFSLTADDTTITIKRVNPFKRRDIIPVRNIKLIQLEESETLSGSRRYDRIHITWQEGDKQRVTTLFLGRHEYHEELLKTLRAVFPF